jgi:hypothetical protein
MEIEIIRPLFKSMGIEDTLPIILKYLHDKDYSSNDLIVLNVIQPFYKDYALRFRFHDCKDNASQIGNTIISSFMNKSFTFKECFSKMKIINKRLKYACYIGNVGMYYISGNDKVNLLGCDVKNFNNKKTKKI